VLSYGIRQTPRSGRDTVVFDLDDCRKIVDADFLLTPQEQADNLILWFGETLTGPGEKQRIDFLGHAAIVGARSESGFFFVIRWLISSGLVEGAPGYALIEFWEITLTFAGWDRFEQLRRGTPRSRRAFMAMQYRDPLLDRLVNDHFRSAVAQTGFELRRLDDEQPAGLIDDRLRVEIQSCRFLIADLTHGNRGAYWKAGFAEGLGKPVIYTCEHTKMKDTHFDTNHHLIVPWDEGAMDAAMKKLKDTIRATIPEATRE